MEPENIYLARQAYDAYGATTDHKNYQGLPMPKWEELPEKIQTAWVAAAERVAGLARPLVAPQPPVSNDYVAPGCESFSSDVIAANSR